MTKISIHVDGYYGLVHGVPRLLNLFDKKGIKATFFVNMGREASLLEILKHYRKKNPEMRNTREAGKRYSKVQLAKTLLLRRRLGHGYENILQEIERRGHKVEPHCWSHLEWSKNFDKMDLKKQIGLIKGSYNKCLGKNPTAFAPPTWKVDKRVLHELELNGFQKVCVLDKDIPMFKGFKNIKPEILTFDKTIEELLGEGKTEQQILDIYKQEMNKKNAHIYFHADYEGRQGLPLLDKVLSLE